VLLHGRMLAALLLARRAWALSNVAPSKERSFASDQRALPALTLTGRGPFDLTNSRPATSSSCGHGAPPGYCPPRLHGCSRF
jgi:hypothetical protein